MTLWDLLILLLVAGICGAIGQAISGFSRGGCLAAIGFGLVGALLGRYLSGAIGLAPLFVVNAGGAAIPIVWTILGALLLSLVVAIVQRPSRR